MPQTTFRAVEALDGFTGDLTGDVTGDVTGNVLQWADLESADVQLNAAAVNGLMGA